MSKYERILALCVIQPYSEQVILSAEYCSVLQYSAFRIPKSYALFSAYPLLQGSSWLYYIPRSYTHTCVWQVFKFNVCFGLEVNDHTTFEVVFIAFSFKLYFFMIFDMFHQHFKFLHYHLFFYFLIDLFFCGAGESNPAPLTCQASTLPLSHDPSPLHCHLLKQPYTIYLAILNS